MATTLELPGAAAVLFRAMRRHVSHSETGARDGLPRYIIVLGIISFLTAMSSAMVYELPARPSSA